MATKAAELYEDDFYAWTREQATALRRMAGELPELCPYALAALLDDDWYPRNRHGIMDET